MNLNEMYSLNSLFKSFNKIEEIYDKVITQLIKSNKLEINKNENEMVLSFTISNILNEKKNIIIKPGKSIKDNNEYINILINEIKNLRHNTIINELKEENKLIINEIKKLKQMVNDILIDQFNTKFNLSINNYTTQLFLNDQKLDNKIFDYLNKINIKDLKELHLNNNLIDDIRLLKNINYEKLEKLNLRGNKITNIIVLENVIFINLQYLHLGNNDITDITPLTKANFEKLEILNLGRNKISDISALEMVNFKELKELHLFKNDISNIIIPFFKINVLYNKTLNL